MEEIYEFEIFAVEDGIEIRFADLYGEGDSYTFNYDDAKDISDALRRVLAGIV